MRVKKPIFALGSGWPPAAMLEESPGTAGQDAG